MLCPHDTPHPILSLRRCRGWKTVTGTNCAQVHIGFLGPNCGDAPLRGEHFRALGVMGGSPGVEGRSVPVLTYCLEAHGAHLTHPVTQGLLPGPSS